MRTRTKSALLLTVVLLLGVAIGIVLAGALNNRRMKRIAHLRTGPGIVQLVEHTVRPESDEQREQIREVMDDVAPRFAELFLRTQEDMRALSDSVMGELEEILTPQQMEALRTRMEVRRGGMPPGERREMERGRRRPRPDGAPPGGTPPGGSSPEATPPPPGS